MEISILLIEQIFSLVLMGISGYVLRKLELISHEGSKGLTAVCIYICIPCVLFHSFQTEISPERMAGFVYALIAVIFIHIVFFAGMWIFVKVYPMSTVEAVSIIYSNAGNMIIPLVTGVFGQDYLFYTSAYLFVQNALIWSHAKTKIAGSGQASWRKIFLHPCILSIFAGILFLLMRWSLPEVVSVAVSGMALCIGPLSMLVIGMLIAEVDLKKVFINSRIYVVVVFRLFIYPLLAMGAAFLIWKLFPVRIDPIVYLIVLLGACGPAATTVTQLSQMYDNEAGYASSINILTTLGSVVTMPIIIATAQMLL